MIKFLQSSLIGLIQMVHDMAKEIEDIKREAADLFMDQEVSKELTFNTYNLSFQRLRHSARFSDFS